MVCERRVDLRGDGYRLKRLKVGRVCWRGWLRQIQTEVRRVYGGEVGGWRWRFGGYGVKKVRRGEG